MTENEPRRWRRICCAVDLSDSSHVVLQQAGALARWVGAELVLLHVVVPQSPAALDMLSIETEGERPGDLAAEVLNRLRAEAEGVLGRPVRSSIARGQPAHEIPEFAEVQGMDAIVVGTHGRTGRFHAWCSARSQRPSCARRPARWWSSAPMCPRLCR